MKILSVELVPRAGTQVTFESAEDVQKDDYFQVTVNERTYNLQAVGMKVLQNTMLITAKDVSYKALDKSSDFRAAINCEVVAVKDPETIKKIYKQSCYI